MDRTFTFISGYTIQVKPDWNPQLLQMATDQWMRVNPIPTPPTRKVPVKGGEREVALPNHPAYQTELNAWSAAQGRFHDDARIMLAIDPASIDSEVVQAARDYAEDIGLELPASDVLVYIQTVAQPGTGAPGEADYVQDERDLLEKFIDGVKGPNEALVTHLLRTRFRRNLPGAGHLAVPAQAEGRDQPTDPPDAYGGGALGPAIVH